MRVMCFCLFATLLIAGCGTDSAEPPVGDGASLEAGSGGVNLPEHRSKPYVLMVSFDGFRADYFGRVETPAFDRVAREGAQAEALIPVFPSKTFPNHYSIATGMYPESHGIVGNRFYDPERGQHYSIRDRETVMDGSWYRGEPIWVTAETQGMVSATFFWVGSEADVQGVRPTRWTVYDASIPNRTRVDSVIAWLELPEEHRPHLIALYFSDVDDAGHRFGPDGAEVDAAIREVDASLGYLLEGLDRLPIREEIYLVLVSDHGMASYSPSTAVALDDLVDLEGITISETGPLANLHVTGTRSPAVVRDSINLSLEHGRAYLRADVPGHLRYRADPRVGDIVVIMDEHWQIRPRASLPDTEGGTHGWDPRLPSMQAIFLASGPGIPSGTRLPAFESVHIYPFLARVLSLRPGRDVEGDPDWLVRRLGGHPQ